MSDETDKTPKIQFAPGVLEELEEDMTPEELQEFMNELKMMVEDGSFFDKSEAVDLDELKTTDPELYEILVEQLENIDDSSPTVH